MVKIRLQRQGKKKFPFYHIVVAKSNFYYIFPFSSHTYCMNVYPNLSNFYKYKKIVKFYCIKA